MTSRAGAHPPSFLPLLFAARIRTGRASRGFTLLLLFPPLPSPHAQIAWDYNPPAAACCSAPPLSPCARPATKPHPGPFAPSTLRPLRRWGWGVGADLVAVRPKTDPVGVEAVLSFSCFSEPPVAPRVSLWPPTTTPAGLPSAAAAAAAAAPLPLPPPPYSLRSPWKGGGRSLQLRLLVD